MEEEMEEVPKERKYISISNIIAMLSIIFAVSLTAFLLGMKFFSSTHIHARIEGSSPETQDPLGDVLTRTLHGLTNIQIAGKTYYEQYCMVCHGEQGKGDGFNAFNLDPKPKDLTKVLKTASNEVLFNAILGGTAGADGRFQCPPWGRTLGEDKINAIIAYIHSFKEDTSQDTDPH